MKKLFTLSVMLLATGLTSLHATEHWQKNFLLIVGILYLL